MKLLLMLLIAIMPGIILLTFIHKEEIKQKKNFHKYFLFLIGGMLAGTLAIFIAKIFKYFNPIYNYSYDGLTVFQIIFSVLIIVALVEEISKWILFWIVNYENRFKKPKQLVKSLITLSVGFAMLENVFYIVHFIETESILLAVFRGFISLPFHVFLGMVMSFFIIKTLKGKNRFFYTLCSVLYPVILHYLYNLLIIKHKFITFVIFALLVIISYLVIISNLKKYYPARKKNNSSEK